MVTDFARSKYYGMAIQRIRRNLLRGKFDKHWKSLGKAKKEVRAHLFVDFLLLIFW
jgi:hypothetical protein